MKCSFRYPRAEVLGMERSPQGAPCPNHANYEAEGKPVCWLHRPDLKSIVRCQQALPWLIWGVDETATL